VRFLVVGTVVSLVLVSIFSAAGASGGGCKAAVIPAFTPAQLSAQAGVNWPSEQGNLQSHPYSTLAQITPADGASLKVAWTTHLADSATPERRTSANASPIVYDGRM
jgi:glucose dehydrogenase